MKLQRKRKFLAKVRNNSVYVGVAQRLSPAAKVLNIPVTPTTIMFFPTTTNIWSLLLCCHRCSFTRTITLNMYPSCESRPKNVKNVGHTDPSGGDPFPCKQPSGHHVRNLLPGFPRSFLRQLTHLPICIKSRISSLLPSRFTYHLHFLFYLDGNREAFVQGHKGSLSLIPPREGI